MVGVAKRVAPTMHERWDDMAQVGYQTWIHCARKYDPSHGIPAKQFLLPIVKHEMRRWHRRETAHSMGDTPYRVMRGEAVEHRTNVQTEENPEGINGLGDDDAPTPEQQVIQYHTRRKAMVALWKAAEELGVPYHQWRNMYFRNCLLSDRMPAKEVRDRFNLGTGSLTFFRQQLIKKTMERL